MMPKSGYRFSDQIMLKQKHDPEKLMLKPTCRTGAPSEAARIRRA
jgi:hypothetical protein